MTKSYFFDVYKFGNGVLITSRVIAGLTLIATVANNHGAVKIWILIKRSVMSMKINFLHDCLIWHKGFRSHDGIALLIQYLKLNFFLTLLMIFFHVKPLSCLFSVEHQNWQCF